MPALEPPRLRLGPFCTTLALLSAGCAPASEAQCGEGVFFGDLISVYSDMPDEPLGLLILFVGPARRASGLVGMDDGVPPGDMWLEVNLDCSTPDIGAWDIAAPDCRAFVYAEFEPGSAEWAGEFRGECYPEPAEGPTPVYDPPSTPFRFEFTAHRVGPSLTAAER